MGGVSDSYYKGYVYGYRGIIVEPIATNYRDYAEGEAQGLVDAFKQKESDINYRTRVWYLLLSIMIAIGILFIINDIGAIVRTFWETQGN